MSWRKSKTFSRLQVLDCALRSYTYEALAAISRRSPDAAYWYARDAAHRANVLLNGLTVQEG